MMDENGQIAVDFLLGISLFLIALIFVVQFIPGLFMPGSADETSMDYTAYRTATILVEDPGWWRNSTSSSTDWESHPDNIMRIGLAVDDDNSSKSTNLPNLLSKSKVQSLMLVNESTLINRLGLYNNINDAIFAYGYNISITKDEQYLILNNQSITLGNPVPDDRETSKIKRIVLMETGFVANIDAADLPKDPSMKIPGIENTILNISGPFNDQIIIKIYNLNITGVDPSLMRLELDGKKLNSGKDYTPYKIVNGTELPLTSTGKIDDNSTLALYFEPGLFGSSQTYQLEIYLKDITFTKTAPPVPEYSDYQEIFYQPAYLTVEVWQ